MVDSLDMRRLLSPIGAERFFADHWQSRMALLPLAEDDLAFIRQTVGSLDPARLAGAAREGAQAWLANDFVAHSVFPINPQNAAQFREAKGGFVELGDLRRLLGRQSDMPDACHRFLPS